MVILLVSIAEVPTLIEFSIFLPEGLTGSLTLRLMLILMLLEGPLVSPRV